MAGRKRRASDRFVSYARKAGPYGIEAQIGRRTDGHTVILGR